MNTPNFDWPLPDKLGLQGAEIEKIAAALLAVDASLKEKSENLDASKLLSGTVPAARLPPGILPAATTVFDTTDFNTLTAAGFQPGLYLGSAANGPGAGYYHVQNLVYGGQQITQIAWPYATGSAGMLFRGRYTGTWSAWQKVTTKAEMDAAIAAAVAGLVNSSPATLDTLKELATALGDDANFAATMTTQLGLKLNAASYTAADVLAKLLTVDGPDSNVDADKLDGLHAASFLRHDADNTLVASIVVPTANRNRGIIGSYDPAKTQQIWAMGAAYLSAADGANFGALYGLAYKHTNNATGGTMAGGHQAVWCQAGTPTAAIGSGLWTSGDIDGLSDERVKTNFREVKDPLKIVRQLKTWMYDRTDTGEKSQIGLIAQVVRKAMPRLVSGNPKKGLLSIKYNSVVAVAVGAIANLDGIVAAQAAAHKAEIKELNKRIAALESALQKRG